MIGMVGRFNELAERHGKDWQIQAGDPIRAEDLERYVLLILFEIGEGRPILGDARNPIDPTHP